MGILPYLARQYTVELALKYTWSLTKESDISTPIHDKCPNFSGNVTPAYITKLNVFKTNLIFYDLVCNFAHSH